MPHACESKSDIDGAGSRFVQSTHHPEVFQLGTEVIINGIHFAWAINANDGHAVLDLHGIEVFATGLGRKASSDSLGLATWCWDEEPVLSFHDGGRVILLRSTMK